MTDSRLKLIDKRKVATNKKFIDITNTVKIAKEEARIKTLKFDLKHVEYKKQLLELKISQDNYRSMLKQNAVLQLIEKDVSKVCMLKICNEKCVPLMNCEICQPNVEIPAKQWDCKTKIETVRTSQLVETDQICQETKYFFVPIYTGKSFGFDFIS